MSGERELCSAHQQMAEELRDVHGTLCKLVGKYEVQMDSFQKTLEVLFEKAKENNECILAIKRDLNNGWKSRAEMLDRKIDALVQEMAGVKTSAKRGILGFVDKSWQRFCDQAGWILIAFALWGIAKAVVFGEIPSLFK